MGLSGAHIQSSGRLRAPSPAPDSRGWGWRVEAEAEGGGSSREVGGRGEADLSAKPRGSSRPGLHKLKLPGKWRTVLSLPPPCRQQPRLRTLRDPFPALSVRLCGATGQPGGIGSSKPRTQPSSRASPARFGVRLGLCLRLFTPTPVPKSRIISPPLPIQR